MAKSPNILLIFTDQQRLSAVGAYGPTPCSTPHIDRLASQGVRFEQVYTTCPVCSPARATIMTGQYPHAHGITSNVHNLGCNVQELEDRPALLSRRLESAGYSLGYSGKWHLGTDRRTAYGGRNRPSLPEDVGFEGQNFPGHGGGGFGYPEYRRYLSEHGWEHRVKPWNEPTQHVWPMGELEGPLESTVPYFLAEHTIDLIDRFAQRDKPFFIWHNFWGPHGPFYAPKEFVDRYRDVEIPRWPNYEWPSRSIPGPHHVKIHPDAERLTWDDWAMAIRYYYAFTTLIDSQIGRIVHHLEQTGLMEDTVILFAADHGQTLGSHGGLIDKGWHHFEETHRIPLIVRFPDGAYAGRVISEPVSLADLYPTVLDIAHGTWDSESIHGESLMSLISGENARWRDEAVTEFGGVNDLATTQRTLRWGHLKYGYNCCCEDELYDLSRDPHETRNVIHHPGYREVADDFRRRLADWMERTNDPARRMFRTAMSYYRHDGAFASTPRGKRIPETNWPRAKRARVEAARRRRRIIFNDDTYELSREDANTPEGFLKRRLEPLVGTHVDTISWSVLGGWADAPVYDSKVQPIYGDAHGGPPPYWSAVTENVKALIEAGRCPLQIVVDFAHDNGMEAFASVRMNDVHDSFIEGGVTMWKRRHPELLVDTKGLLPGFELYVTAQDFSHEEVRRRKLEIIEEICERYDVDGFELDYIRHPVFFSRTMRGLRVTEEEAGIMTFLMRRIRQITDEAAGRRGRALLLAARVPDTFELAMHVGLDLRTWLEEDLVDLLIVGGGYAPFTLPVEDFVGVAHRHGAFVYPCINQGTADGVSEGAFQECVRALATNWYRADADGIYLWNLGTPFEYKSGEDLIATRRRFYACLNEIGDPRALVGKDKLFCVDNASAEVFDYYAHISSRPPLPLTSKQGVIRHGVIQRVPLVVGDDLAVGRSGLSAEAKLTIALDDPAWRGVLLFRLNGETLAGGDFIPSDVGGSACRMTYPVSAPPLKLGRNFIEISAKHVEGLPPRPAQISRIELKVEYTTEGR